MAVPYDVEIDLGSISLKSIRQFYQKPGKVSLTEAVLDRVAKSAKTVDDIVAKGDAAYGINTGFGLLANTRIEDQKLAELQRNLVLSHAAGVGQPMDDRVVRLMMLLKIISLSRGYSGIRVTVLHTLLAVLNKGLVPQVPEKGSVGASGDLAPLAHLALCCMGEGEIKYDGEIMPAMDALARAGIAPITLGPKEGLALLNGTQASTALALKGLFGAEDVFAATVVAGALSVDALKGSKSPFDPRIHTARGQPGQMDVAAKYLSLLDGSEIMQSHVNCDRIQDPYSLRCQPQVMGAALDVIRSSAAMLEREANAATDNPLIFTDEGDVVSGGNFHAEPVAFASDMLALPLVEMGAISERRLAILVDPKMSGLPAFLVEDSGLNSGFMIAQVTAAALVSENKTLAHPASVDSIPTSANQEDHVSMATFAARRLTDMSQNTAYAVAVELLAAAQGQDFHKPLKTSATLQVVMNKIREKVSFYEKDRYFAPDIEAIAELVTDGFCREWAGDLLPSHE